MHAVADPDCKGPYRNQMDHLDDIGWVTCSVHPCAGTLHV